mmetsp:Transcript_49148/g.137629  ORF Transcript_49148/g.137629 Transcript_49148/m.137629 type:complete len:203 (-) Transcript_49148:13-621(-)
MRSSLKLWANEAAATPRSGTKDGRSCNKTACRSRSACKTRVWIGSWSICSWSSSNRKPSKKNSCNKSCCFRSSCGCSKNGCCRSGCSTVSCSKSGFRMSCSSDCSNRTVRMSQVPLGSSCSHSNSKCISSCSTCQNGSSCSIRCTRRCRWRHRRSCSGNNRFWSQCLGRTGRGPHQKSQPRKAIRTRTRQRRCERAARHLLV